MYCGGALGLFPGVYSPVQFSLKALVGLYREHGRMETRLFCVSIPSKTRRHENEHE